MGPYKVNHKQDKRQIRMGENICKWSNWQKISLQNIQKLMQLNIRKTSQSKTGWGAGGFPGGSVVESTGQWRRHEFDPWSRKTPHATKWLTLCHNYWDCAPEPGCKDWADVPQLLKPACPTACAPQQEKILQWEADTAMMTQHSQK